MPQIWTVVVAAVVSFLLSSAWYVALGRVSARLSPAYVTDRQMPPWVGLVGVVRTAVVEVVVGLD